MLPKSGSSDPLVGPRDVVTSVAEKVPQIAHARPLTLSSPFDGAIERATSRISRLRRIKAFAAAAGLRIRACGA